MYCQKCGEKIEDGSVFCNNCGSSVGSDFTKNLISENKVKNGFKKLIMIVSAFIIPGLGHILVGKVKKGFQIIACMIPAGIFIMIGMVENNGMNVIGILIQIAVVIYTIADAIKTDFENH